MKHETTLFRSTKIRGRGGGRARRPLRPARAVVAAAAAVAAALLLQASFPTASAAAVEKRPGDARIAAAVEADLLFDSSVPSNDISVRAADGIVTLGGSAPNLLARERAVMIASTVRGVRSVIDEIAVRPVDRSDARIRGDVEDALLADPATDSYEVRVAVDDGIVTLTGTVQSWQEKNLSTSVAKGVKGIRDVRNHLLVSPPVTRPDGEIAADVRAALQGDVWVDALGIRVSVEDARVTLSGVVGSVSQRNRARAVAWVGGVQAVDDDGLRVEAWADDEMKKDHEFTLRSDEEIRKAVRTAFLLDPRVLSFNPDVQVDRGVVTLTGTVDNLKAKRSAGQDARNTSGVWRVKNFLKIHGADVPPDDKLADNVRKALERDPYIERYAVDVKVRNGVVLLDGSVDSFYEKTHAEDVASRLEGVKAVQNDLDVSYPFYAYYYWPFATDFYEPYYYSRPPVYRTWPYVSDLEVKDEIQDELFWSPFVDSDDVEVSVRNGVATLTGEVDGWNEYAAAADNAWEGGARGVINNLKVR